MSENVRLAVTAVLGLIVGAAVTFYKCARDEDTLGPDAHPADRFAEYKMVLVVRTDLGMTKGKAAAQCCHAALGCYKAALERQPDLVRFWERQGQPKITVQTKGEPALVALQAQAQRAGIAHCLIHDAGRTQIAAGSATVLGLGPARKDALDAITGALKLY